MQRVRSVGSDGLIGPVYTSSGRLVLAFHRGTCAVAKIGGVGMAETSGGLRATGTAITALSFTGPPHDMQTLTRPFTESPLNGVPPRVAARNEAALPLALKLIAITTFLPEELSFYILGLRFTAIRLILIVLTPLLLIRLGQRLAAGRYRFVLSDIFVFLEGFWMIYAPANVVGVGQALNHAGPTALEFCVGYMATRLLLSEHGHALSFAALLCRVIAIVALLALLDPLTNRSLIHYLASQLTGYQKPLVTVDIYRLGLLRATGPIEHAILFGFACAVGLLIAASIPIRSRSFAI